MKNIIYNITYKGQLIIVFSENDVCYYLYGESGDLNERKAKSVEEAKQMIDMFYRTDGGFYDAYGDLYTY